MPAYAWLQIYEKKCVGSIAFTQAYTHVNTPASPSAEPYPKGTLSILNPKVLAPTWVLCPRTKGGGGGLHALSPHRACGAGWETGPSDPTCGPGAGSRVSGQVCSMWASDTPRSLKPWSNVQTDGWVPYCPLLGRSRRAHVSQGLHSDSSRGQFPFISGRCMAFLLLLFVFSSTAPPQRETHSAYT